MIHMLLRKGYFEKRALEAGSFRALFSEGFLIRTEELLL